MATLYGTSSSDWADALDYTLLFNLSDSSIFTNDWSNYLRLVRVTRSLRKAATTPSAPAVATTSIHGQDGNDTLYGEGGDYEIDGGDNNDTLFGGAGGDDLNGGSGIDEIMYLGFVRGVTDQPLHGLRQWRPCQWRHVQ